MLIHNWRAPLNYLGVRSSLDLESQMALWQKVRSR
jgi:hypothetical protein